MSQDGPTHFKNLAASIFKVCLTILGNYVLKGCKRLIILTYIHIFIKDCGIYIDFDKINRKYLQVTK